MRMGIMDERRASVRAWPEPKRQRLLEFASSLMSDRDDWHELAAFTPARIALGRAGNGLPTRRVLEFQLAHAQARDAVQGRSTRKRRRRARPIRHVCVLEHPRHRPGRVPDESGCRSAPQQRLAHRVGARKLRRRARHRGRPVVDRDRCAWRRDSRVSSWAVLPGLNSAPLCIVTGGRVAIGDDIAMLLGAELAVVLIGERPGLSAADAVGIYLTFAPQHGVTKDADRNCISNVRPDGLSLDDAAHRLAWLVAEARRLRLTGVMLKEDAPDLHTLPAPDRL